MPLTASHPGGFYVPRFPSVNGAQTLGLLQSGGLTVIDKATAAQLLAAITQTSSIIHPASGINVNGAQTLSAPSQSLLVALLTKVTAGQTLSAAQQTTLVKLVDKLTGAQTVNAATQSGSISGATASSITWSATDSHCTLSSDKLTATNPSGGGYGARVTTDFTGQKYFEFYINNHDVGATVGLTDPLNEPDCQEPRPGTDLTSVGWNSFGGIQTAYQGSGGQTLASATPPGTGQAGRIAVNETTRMFWASRIGDPWNGDSSANPATGVGGVSFPSGFRCFISMRFEGTGLDSVTLCAASASWRGTAPSGFTAI